MMNGIAPGPLLILLGLVIGVVLLIALVSSRRKRKGGRIVAAGLLMLLLVAGVSLLFMRISHSRAMAEYDRAVAMREQAMRQEEIARQSWTAASARLNTPHVESKTESEDETEDLASEAFDANLMKSTVDDLNRKVQEEVDSLNAEIRANAGASGRRIEVKTHRPDRPVDPIQVESRSRRTGLPDRSVSAQIVMAILLAGVVLAGYFFLNANTRGHYTWRLRIGSTLVFAASLAIILLITLI